MTYLGKEPSGRRGIWKPNRHQRRVASNKWLDFLTEVEINGVMRDLTTGYGISTYGFYSLVVPQNAVLNLALHLWGAGGGGGISSTPTSGSCGGYVYGEMSLQGGTYTLVVGRGGLADGTGGWPDGGTSVNYGGGAGGSSRFGGSFINTTASLNATSAVYYLIAGGGGAGCNYAGYGSNNRGGGVGGGLSGKDGSFYYNSGENAECPGKGGTQSAGGAGGAAGRTAAGSAGSKYQGGAGGSGGGGAGGGGYYGGGGAGGYYAHGGGGSGFINTTYVSNGQFQQSTEANYSTAPAGLTSKPATNTGNGGLGTSNAASRLGFDGGAVLQLFEA